MNVVDTSGWLEYFAGGKNSAEFSIPIKAFDELIMPTICIYEISKVILRESDENHLLQVLAAMQKGKIVELTSALAIAAAKVSRKYQLPMADSIIFTTAIEFRACVWTQDADFNNLPNVRYLPKTSGN